MAQESFKQREHYRVPLGSQVIIEPDDGRSLKGVCLNISMGGMRLSLDDALSGNTSGIARMMYEQDGETVEFWSRFFVAWTGMERKEVPFNHSGIQFTGLDYENQSRLTRVLIARLTEIEISKQDGKYESMQIEKADFSR